VLLPVFLALIAGDLFRISLYAADMLVPKLLSQREKDFENPQSSWQILKLKFTSTLSKTRLYKLGSYITLGIIFQ
jgi:hypothetical protein